MVNKKLQIWLPLILAVVMIVGMVLGYQLGNNAGERKGFFSSNKRSSLQEAVDLIRLKYVDSVNLDSIQGAAIEDMMNALDPHSVYLPPVKRQKEDEDLAGKFDGIGVEFNVFSDTVNVIYVIPGGPSDEAGLQIGDKILAADTTTLVGRTFTAAEIMKAIKGPQGSKVTLRLLRDGKGIALAVTRGSIPVSSIDAAYMIDGTTGYIKLNKFTENSYEEFMQALEMLQKQGMKSLVYDLRGNGGGFMNEAVDMADEFLSGDKLIVYTEGVNSKKREYSCKREGLFETGQLVILVDELTASASEVLTGALQDWDRATVIGRRTFGKGLVQEQYSLSDGSAIRLTVARYYTPLGRSIQRSYANGKKVYMDELWQRYSNGELLYADSNKISDGKKYSTPSGRVLYGGGGIMPDIFVPIDTSTYQRGVNKVILDNGFSKVVHSYFMAHRAQINSYKNAGDYTRNFSDDAMWNDLVQYAAKADTVNLQTISTREKTALQQRLKALLARYKWRNSGFFEVLNADDTAIRKAVETIRSTK